MFGLPTKESTNDTTLVQYLQLVYHLNLRLDETFFSPIRILQASTYKSPLPSKLEGNKCREKYLRDENTREEGVWKA